MDGTLPDRSYWCARANLVDLPLISLLLIMELIHIRRVVAGLALFLLLYPLSSHPVRASFIPVQIYFNRWGCLSGWLFLWCSNQTENEKRSRVLKDVYLVHYYLYLEQSLNLQSPGLIRNKDWDVWVNKKRKTKKRSGALSIEDGWDSTSHALAC